jgi:hypothetical protein
MKNEYRVQSLGGCKIIWGDVPINDFQYLTKMVDENAIMDSSLANKIGANFVLGSPEDIAALKLRDDLPISEARLRDVALLREKGLNISEPTQSALQNWLINGERGSSSNAICKVLHGVPENAGINYPHDPADFRRCHLFLAETHSRHLIHKMSGISKEWTALVKRWDEIETSYLLGCNQKSGEKTYALMEEILQSNL